MEDLVDNYLNDLKIIRVEFKNIYKYYVRDCKKNNIENIKHKVPFSKKLYNLSRVHREVKNGITFVCIKKESSIVETILNKIENL